MSAREPGAYWVDTAVAKAEVAFWDGDAWWLWGIPARFMPGDVDVVSPRLTRPDATETVPALTVRWGVPVGDAPDADTAGVLHGGGGG